jgi:hypothetical protein
MAAAIFSRSVLVVGAGLAHSILQELTVRPLWEVGAAPRGKSRASELTGAFSSRRRRRRPGIVADRAHRGAGFAAGKSFPVQTKPRQHFRYAGG